MRTPLKVFYLLPRILSLQATEPCTSSVPHQTYICYLTVSRINPGDCCIDLEGGKHPKHPKKHHAVDFTGHSATKLMVGPATAVIIASSAADQTHMPCLHVPKEQASNQDKKSCLLPSALTGTIYANITQARPRVDYGLATRMHHAMLLLTT